MGIAIYSNEMGKLTQCLKPYDAACQSESIYKLNIEAFKPSTFGCNGKFTWNQHRNKLWWNIIFFMLWGKWMLYVLFIDNGSLQCDVKAIQRCYNNLDTSTIVTNVTQFCKFVSHV